MTSPPRDASLSHAASSPPCQLTVAAVPYPVGGVPRASRGCGDTHRRRRGPERHRQGAATPAGAAMRGHSPGANGHTRTHGGRWGGSNCALRSLVEGTRDCRAPRTSRGALPCGCAPTALLCDAERVSLTRGVRLLPQKTGWACAAAPGGVPGPLGGGQGHDPEQRECDGHHRGACRACGLVAHAQRLDILSSLPARRRTGRRCTRPRTRATWRW